MFGLFLDASRIENNSNVEHSICPIALTRKKDLFAGSDGSAENGTVVASMVETCKLIGVKPPTYLAAVIARIVRGHPNSRLDEHLP